MKNQILSKCKSVLLSIIRINLIIILSGIILLFSTCRSSTQQFSNDIGKYPGSPDENFAPVSNIDKSNYRNLAVNRAAYHSSSYDYNLTAQLTTDGIINNSPPYWTSASTSEHGPLKKNEREWIFDHSPVTTVNLNGTKVWIQIELGDIENIPEIIKLNISGNLQLDGRRAKRWEHILYGSDDGLNWEELSSASGRNYPGEVYQEIYKWHVKRGPTTFNQDFNIPTPSSKKFYRVELNSPNVKNWLIGEIELYDNKDLFELAGSHRFSSAWKSAGTKNEWVYVDLGAECEFDKIKLYWINKATSGSIQVSYNTSDWENIANLSDNTSLIDDISLDSPSRGRYVRILMNELNNTKAFILSEIEIFGTGGPVFKNHQAPEIKDKNRIDLTGGNWKIQRESIVKSDGELLSKTEYNDSSWIIATVPGTALVSYLNIGALPDPNYGDNQLMISESFFNSDFWYRNEFIIPSTFKKEHIFLNFDGINWKAEIFLNGNKLGLIEGAFKPGKFDISNLIIPGENNALAVRIIKNATPGNVKEQTIISPDMNGGSLGADNPTYHASIGWDWIPTIRGRNTGIWNDVYLSSKGPITIENPFISTKLPLPDITTADVNIELSLHNHITEAIEGTLEGKIGDITFEQSVVINGSSTKKINIDPSSVSALHIQNPKLWWPNGYGEQNLYDVELSFKGSDNKISDSKSFKTGLRQMTSNEDRGILKIWINGKRFIGRGGNWGFPESMLRYRNREYDIAVRYHKEMNFTMIRNWVGQTADEEFYEACDRYGIMIWQDFWLANPWDGPDPSDYFMFMDNVENYVKRIRNHPSIALYCGRNEGNPPEELDNRIREVLPEIHPGIHYISHSSAGPVSGFGPYGIKPVKFYFEERATEKMHSELGMPNILSYESMQKMMPDSTMWPIGRMWGLHDYCLEGNVRAIDHSNMFENSFGKVNNAEEWVSLAQWINYNGYRAMFEAQSKNRMGLVIWMSHPAWPSLVWQTYDFYFEPTAAYFGCKKASEPLHIQWNTLTDNIEVVNYSHPDVSDLTAKAEIINLDGKVVWEKEASVESTEDSVVECFKMEYPSGLSDVYFLRLKLKKDNDIISENIYWRGIEENNYKAIHEVPKINLETSTKIEREADKWFITTDLANNSEHPALMVRLKVIKEQSGDRILPVIYSDNYIFIMPGENRSIKMELEHADTRGERPFVEVTGYNVN